VLKIILNMSIFDIINLIKLYVDKLLLKHTVSLIVIIYYLRRHFHKSCTLLSVAALYIFISA